jgi:hypothetical protein
VRRAAGLAALLASLLIAHAAKPSGAFAQDAPAPDSVAVGTVVSDSVAAESLDLSPANAPAADSVATVPPSDVVDAQRLDRDRFEWGFAFVQGYFDGLGTFAYRRFLREGGPFQQNIVIEVQGGKKGYLSEGAVSLLYLFRPIRTFRPEWRIRPLLEVGPGGHVVVQVADIEGFDDTGFHTKAYGKMHAYAGVEALISRRWGILLRGRFTAPANRPLDYAQAAIFLR